MYVWVTLFFWCPFNQNPGCQAPLQIRRELCGSVRRKASAPNNAENPVDSGASSLCKVLPGGPGVCREKRRFAICYSLEQIFNQTKYHPTIERASWTYLLGVPHILSRNLKGRVPNGVRTHLFQLRENPCFYVKTEPPFDSGAGHDEALIWFLRPLSSLTQLHPGLTLLKLSQPTETAFNQTLTSEQWVAPRLCDLRPHPRMNKPDGLRMRMHLPSVHRPLGIWDAEAPFDWESSHIQGTCYFSAIYVQCKHGQKQPQFDCIPWFNVISTTWWRVDATALCKAKAGTLQGS
ncbi:hypothetical protein C8R43DRAFT_955683 [Mycena crocata]|nr:hypothetical protein C8R43DRAFT_955683 [Mycena crocata]